MRCPVFPIRSLSVGDNMISAISKNNQILSWDYEAFYQHDNSYNNLIAKKVVQGIVLVCILDEIGDIYCHDKMQEYSFKLDGYKIKQFVMYEPILCAI